MADVAQSERVQIADILEREAESIVARWAGELHQSLYPEQPPRALDSLRDSALPLVRAAAQALRLGPEGRRQADWARLAGQFSHRRVAEGVQLAGLLRELELLRQEMWHALQEEMTEVPAAATFGVAAELDDVLGTLTVAAGQACDEARARLAAQAAEQRVYYETVIANSPAGIAVLRGPDFIVELVNRAGQAVLPGVAPIGKPVTEVSPRSAPLVLPILRQVLETGEPYQAVDARFPVRRVAGGPLEDGYFTLTFVRLPGPGGRTAAVLAAGIETTAQVRTRRRVEQLAAEAEQHAAQLRAVIDSMDDAVLVVDAEGRITLANEASAAMLGMRPQEALRQNARDLRRRLSARHLDGRPIGRERLPIDYALSGESPGPLDVIIRSPRTGQDAYVRLTAAPIRNDRGEVIGAVVAARDVSEFVELDRMKDQFIAVAAHELKTPVTVMKGYAQMLLRQEPAMPQERREMLEAINRGADRMSRIIADLVDASQLQSGRLSLANEAVELAGLAESVTRRLASHSPRHRVRVVHAETATVRGDPERLSQVLASLIDNAVKYSPQGGDVDVAVHRQGGEGVVSVRDHGVGIPAERQTRIFARFYRAHTGTPYDYGGLGIGLYLSREIVVRQGGRMWFESQEGVGSTFYLALPLAE